MKNVQCIVLICASAALLSLPAFSQEDVEGGKDVPYFTRMTNFYIYETNNKEFDSYKFFNGKSLIAVEGKLYQTAYCQKEGDKRVSELQIRRNFVTAIKKMGGTILAEGTSDLYGDNRGDVTIVTAKVTKGAKEAWIEVWPWSECYTLTVVEKEVMKQEVSATDMLNALNKDGYVALDINFDTGKSTIRDESRPMIEQIVKLLKDNADLKLSIEGHTDNVGDAKSNKTLSEQRAKSVMDAITKAGVDGRRLSAVGYGQEKPVADNRTDEGRAKNRRVELVKK